MQDTPPTIDRGTEPGSGASYVVPAIVLIFFTTVALALYGGTSFFRLSRDTAGLRDCLLASVPGQAEKKLAVNVGWLTSGLVRLGSRLFSVPREPRAALDAFRSAEVGLYRLSSPVSTSQQGAIITQADRSMARRGWTRIVGVAQKDGLVTVYIPAKGVSMGRMRCCVMVVNDCDVVLVSARANLIPLMDLARSHLDGHRPFEQLAAVGLR